MKEDVVSQEVLDKGISFLKEIIKFPSITPNERDVQLYTEEKIKELGFVCERHPIPEEIKNDPEYTWSDKDITYGEDRFNLVVKIKGKENKNSLIINAHNDVVPAEEWKEAFIPYIKEGKVYGRGAADDKGAVAVIYMLLDVIKNNGFIPKGDIIFQIVIEEEIGGNGSLSLIREGIKADGALILECADMKLYPANRGVLWYRLTTYGKPCHMGKIREGVNAIDLAYEAVKIWRNFEKELIEESKEEELFRGYEQPVQFNLGTIHGGEWPSMVPGKCVIEGGMGFLPNRDISYIKRELEERIKRYGSEWLKTHYKLEYPKLHNDAFKSDINHPFIKTAKKVASSCGVDDTLRGWIVSCDARLFNKIGKMPTLVFGPGRLEEAHSNQEYVKIEDLKKSVEFLWRFIREWCG